MKVFIKLSFQLTQSSNTSLGTEIKIPGIGATPVAVSTRLPAAVAQLSQQGKSNKNHFITYFIIQLIYLLLHIELYIQTL